MERYFRNLALDRLDTLVLDAGPGNEHRHPEVAKRVKDFDVFQLDPPPCDHQHGVRQAELVGQAQSREKMLFHPGEEWIGRSIEDLYRRPVGTECPVRDEASNRLLVAYH